MPQYSAVSGLLGPPNSPARLVPGTQSWGYLLVSWSALLAISAMVVALACGASRGQGSRLLGRFLVGLGVASLILVALVVSDLVTSVPFDMASHANSDWGALVGLVLAALASTGAWFAWATWTYPHRWGISPSAQ